MRQFLALVCSLILCYPCFADSMSGGGGSSLATPVTVSNGGTGAATLAAHGLLVGNTTGAVKVTTAGTAGQVLTSNGASADPTFQPAGGGSGGGFTANTIGSGATSATAQNAYFCTATSGTATITLPDATACAGGEIICYLTGSGATMVFNTTSSQTISGQASGSISTTSQYNGYRFISDGSNWQME